MALNMVETSPEYIGSLWADIRRDLGNAPAQTALTPVQSLGSEAVKKMTGATIAFFLFQFFRRKLPHWQVTREECRDIGFAWGGVIDWLFPGEGLRGAMRWIEEKLQAYQPLVDAVKVTGRVAGERITHPEKYALPEPVPADQVGEDRPPVPAPAPKEKAPAAAAGKGQSSMISALREASDGTA